MKPVSLGAYWGATLGLLFALPTADGLGTPPQAPPQLATIRGQIVIHGFADTARGADPISYYGGRATPQGAACGGGWEFSDLNKGTPVTVYNEHDQPVAAAALDQGVAARDFAGTCFLSFRVDDVPDTGRPLYVQIGARRPYRIDDDPDAHREYVVELTFTGGRATRGNQDW